MMGMQGTGSHHVVATELTIPSHRLAAGTDPSETSDADDGSRTLYCGAPLVGGFASYAVAVGAARGALDLYEELLRTRKWLVPPFPLRFEMPEFQLAFGNAQALVDTAEAALFALADRVTAQTQTALEQSMSVPLEDVKRTHRAGLQCIELAWQATDLIFRTSGSSSAASDAALGRVFRGLAVVRTHIGAQPDPVSINVSRLHFGLPPVSPL